MFYIIDKRILIIENGILFITFSMRLSTINAYPLIYQIVIIDQLSELHMQVNSYWKKYLGKRYDHLFNACYCTTVGAWILKQCMDRYGYDWDAVACYHTGYGISDAKSSLKHKNGLRYIHKVKQKLMELEDSRICFTY